MLGHMVRLYILSGAQDTQVRSLGREDIPWRRKWQSTPVFLPGEFCGLKSLVGYSPRSRKESDMTERHSSSLATYNLAYFTHVVACIKISLLFIAE